MTAEDWVRVQNAQAVGAEDDVLDNAGRVCGYRNVERKSERSTWWMMTEEIVLRKEETV